MNADALAGLVVVDTWLANPDRHPRRPVDRSISRWERWNHENVLLERQPRDRTRVVAMDFSVCLHCDNELPRRWGDRLPRDDGIYGLFPAFERHLTVARLEPYLERLREADRLRQHLVEVTARIPDRWHVDRATRDALARFVSDRAAYLADNFDSNLRRVLTRPLEYGLRGPSETPMANGYYCVIQYVPDFSRAEGANVGLVLFEAEPPTTRVRVVEDVRPAEKRLGPQQRGTTLLPDDLRSIAYRIEHAGFGSVDELDRFARTRGNHLQLTLPRPVRIEAIDRDLDRLFAELVSIEPAARSGPKAAGRLRGFFEDLAAQLPGRVFVDHDFHARELGIPIRSDFAYQNGRLNIVREVSMRASDKQVVRQAIGLSKESELVLDLEEGPGSLVVVSIADPGDEKAIRREVEFRGVLEKLGRGRAEFVASAGIEAFERKVKVELSTG